MRMHSASAVVKWRAFVERSPLRRLGHDVHYFEVTSHWPYDPIRRVLVCDSDYALPYLERVARSFGLEGRWAYRRSYSDREWFGLSRTDSVFLGATLIAHFRSGCRAFFFH